MYVIDVVKDTIKKLPNTFNVILETSTVARKIFAVKNSITSFFGQKTETENYELNKLQESVEEVDGEEFVVLAKEKDALQVVAEDLLAKEKNPYLLTQTWNTMLKKSNQSNSQLSILTASQEMIGEGGSNLVNNNANLEANMENSYIEEKEELNNNKIFNEEELIKKLQSLGNVNLAKLENLKKTIREFKLLGDDEKNKTLGSKLSGLTLASLFNRAMLSIVNKNLESIMSNLSSNSNSAVSNNVKESDIRTRFDLLQEISASQVLNEKAIFIAGRAGKEQSLEAWINEIKQLIGNKEMLNGGSHPSKQVLSAPAKLSQSGFKEEVTRILSASFYGSASNSSKSNTM